MCRRPTRGSIGPEPRETTPRGLAGEPRLIGDMVVDRIQGAAALLLPQRRDHCASA